MTKKGAGGGRKREDLTGRQFGDLMVLSPAENKKGRTCWKCICTCGKECIVFSRDLKAGKVKSCGCKERQKGRGIRDLTGQKFGRLPAVYPVEKRDKKGNVYWFCRCDCGNTREVTESALVFGSCQSCGCMKREGQEKIRTRLQWVDGVCIDWLEKKKKQTG